MADEQFYPNVKSFCFTQEHLQDMILVLGAEDGFEEFMSIVRIEASAYLLNTGPRWNETQRQYLLKKLGYA